MKKFSSPREMKMSFVAGICNRMANTNYCISWWATIINCPISWSLQIRNIWSGNGKIIHLTDIPLHLNANDCDFQCWLEPFGYSMGFEYEARGSIYTDSLERTCRRSLSFAYLPGVTRISETNYGKFRGIRCRERLATDNFFWRLKCVFSFSKIKNNMLLM